MLLRGSICAGLRRMTYEKLGDAQPEVLVDQRLS
jgi:hypothetical protein